MGPILYQWEIHPTTWVYISSLMTLAIFFKFSRVWSVRNLDLIGLVALAPGLLLVQHGESVESLGYLWLFAGGGLFLVRMLVDPMMVRRPLLEPNLSPGAMVFMCTFLMLFLMANVVTSDVRESDLDGARQLDSMLAGQSPAPPEDAAARHGPGYPWLHLLPTVSSRALVRVDEHLPVDQEELLVHTATARTMAILSHLAVISGLVIVGSRHFRNLTAGLSAASVYLLLPYTAQHVGSVDHVLPAALLVWAVVAYRRPMLAGMFVGLAAGAIYYPIFLLPLWVGFYWQRGLWRFAVGVVGALVVVVSSLALTSESLGAFLEQMQQLIGWTSLVSGTADGFWATFQPAFRIPVFAAFVALAVSLAIWPANKNLGTLLSCSAVVMLGTQFWHTPHGGLYLGWYLPLMLLTIFRPNLEDRIATNVISERWLSRAPQLKAPPLERSLEQDAASMPSSIQLVGMTAQAHDTTR